MKIAINKEVKDPNVWSKNEQGVLILKKYPNYGVSVTKEFNLKTNETTTILNGKDFNQPLKTTKSGLDKDILFAPKNLLK